MSKSRIQRRKLKPVSNAVVHHVSPSGRYEVNLGEHGVVTCSDLAELADAGKVLKGLNVFLRARRKPRGEANEILRFLRFALQATMMVGHESLLQYRHSLSEDSGISLSTKYQRYRTAQAFVRFLMKSGILPEVVLPEGFDPSKLPANHIPSFSELARRYVDNELNFLESEIVEVSKVLEISKDEARALVFSLECMDSLHQKALGSIADWEKRWEFVQSIVDELTELELVDLRNTPWRDYSRERTVEDAVSLMYVKFGSKPPSVKYWPRGVEDFLRSKGWSKVSSRLKTLLAGRSIDEEDVRLLAFAHSLSIERASDYRALESFSPEEPMFDRRSVRLALSKLYAHYGRLLPRSTDWPAGIVDYLKAPQRGWVPRRVRESFFPTTGSVAPFLVGLLSYSELSPNVDTIAQYAYLTSFRPADEEGSVAVFLDKYRSTPLEKNVPADDLIIAACVRHVTRMRAVLRDIGPIGESLLRLEKTPLWLQYTPSSSLDLENPIRVPDQSTVVGLVRGAIDEYACEVPILKEIREASGENFRPTQSLIMRLSGVQSSEIQKVLNHQYAATTNAYTERVHSQSMQKTRAKRFMQFLVDSCTPSGEEVRALNEANDLYDPSSEGVDKWLGCEAQRVWFRDDDIVAEWVAWEKHIADFAEELMFNNPKRWERYWLPRLTRYQNMLAVVAVVDLERAKIKADDIVLPPID